MTIMLILYYSVEGRVATMRQSVAVAGNTCWSLLVSTENAFRPVLITRATKAALQPSLVFTYTQFDNDAATAGRVFMRRFCLQPIKVESVSR